MRAAFRSNEIDGRGLPDMTADDPMKFGESAFGHVELSGIQQ
jgi:hypothetical protein